MRPMRKAGEVRAPLIGTVLAELELSDALAELERSLELAGAELSRWLDDELEEAEA